MTYTTKTEDFEYGARRVAVIGGGAAGMMAAVTSAELGAKVTVFEKNDRVGKKLRITGKGRCNVTNDCSVQDFLANVPTNPRFLYTALSRFSVDDTKSFFENEGVPLKVERGNRVFPVSDKAADIVAAMHNKCRRAGVTFTFNLSATYTNEMTKTEGRYKFKDIRDNFMEYGLAGGGGIDFIIKQFEFGFRARYYFGFSDLMRNRNKYYDNATDGAENPFSYTPLKSPIDNLTFNITLAYRFNPDGFLEWTYKPTHRRGEKREFKFSNEGDMGNMR